VSLGRLSRLITSWVLDPLAAIFAMAGMLGDDTARNVGSSLYELVESTRGASGEARSTATTRSEDVDPGRSAEGWSPQKDHD
jgi:hypothetical protein